jgi:hypothetical protein
MPAIGRVTSAALLIATSAAPLGRAQHPAGPQPAAPAAPPAAGKDAAAPPAPSRIDDEAAARAEAIKMATPIFRTIIRAELRFIRAASGAADEQARRMSREARGLLTSTVARYADLAVKARREKKDPQDVEWNALYVALHSALASISQGQLSPGQWERLQDQMARREEARKRLLVRMLVVRLDAALGLTAEQLETLAGSLRSHWDPRWEAEDIFSDRNASLPPLPDAIILPFLTAAQKAAWEKLEKAAVGRRNGLSTRLMVELEVAALASQGRAAGDDLDDEAAPAPRP